MQSPVMPSPLGRDLFFGEGEIIVGGDIIDESPKALYRDILSHMSLIQDLY